MRQAITTAAVVLGVCVAFGSTARAESSCLDEGITQYRAENFEEALTLLEQCRAEQPESSVAAFYQGMARKHSGDLPGAVKDLTDAARMTPPVLDSYLELADAYHSQGEHAKALEWVRRSEEAQVHPGRSSFLKGMILNAQGKREEAVVSFEKSKTLDPSLAQAADFQIAIAMAGSRKLTRARDALRAVVAADPNSEMASYAKEYEESFTRIIDSHKAWHVAVGLNYLYDDNAISNPSNAGARALIGEPTGQEDHALLGSLRLDYTPMLAGNLLFSGQYLLQSTKYSDGDNPSTIINSLTLIPGYVLGSSALSLPVNYTHVLLKEEKYQHLASVRPTWSWQFAAQHIVQGGVSYTRREMLKELDPHEDRDANIFGASAGYIHSFGKLGGVASLRYDFSNDNTEGNNWENRGHRLALNGVIPLNEKVKVNLATEVFTQNYLNHHSLLGGVKRDDTTWYGTAGISWQVMPHFTVSAQYAHTTANSNIAVYDYDRNIFSTGLEFDF